MSKVKINQLPSVANPKEDVDYTVVGGDISAGDPVRITTSNGFIFQREPAAPVENTGPAIRTRAELKAAMKAVDATKYATAMIDTRLTYFLTRLAVTETFTKDSAELNEGLDMLVALGLWSAQNKTDFLEEWV